MFKIFLPDPHSLDLNQDGIVSPEEKMIVDAANNPIELQVEGLQIGKQILQSLLFQL